MADDNSLRKFDQCNSFTFKKFEHIRKNYEFQGIYDHGIRSENNYCKLFILNTSQNYSRLGLSVSKKIGNAVVRNRIKRLFREVFRLNKDVWGKGRDIVIVPKKLIVELNFQELKTALIDVFNQNTH